METWRSIPGYEKTHIVSDLGRVKSLDRVVKSKRGTKSIKSKLLSAFFNEHGYKRVCICDGNGNRKTILIHRLVCMAFLENPEGKKAINHKSGIKTDNSLSNLEWCTHTENAIHAFEIGLKAGKKGENNQFSKLTTEQVLEIRSAEGTQREIGEKYNINQATVSRIKTRKKWKHI